VAESSSSSASSEVADRYTAIADGFGARVDGCSGDAWALPTPCTEWTTRDVVEHVVGVHRLVLAMLTPAGPESLGPGTDMAGADLPADWHATTAEMRSALRDPARATRVVTTPFGDMAFAELCSRMLCSDTLVHTWDVARATGQDERLDPHAVQTAWTWMVPAGDRLRASGGFGPPVPPPPGADTQTLLLCFLGRAV